MRFAPSKATLAVAVVIAAAVGGGGFGGSRLLTMAVAHYHAADTAADLKYELSQLGAATDAYALAPTSRSAGTDVATATQMVKAALGSLESNGIEPSEMDAIAAQVDRFVASVQDERRLALQGTARQSQVLATHNDVAFDLLAGRVDLELHEMRGLADQATHDVEVLGLVLAALVLALVGGAVWWDGRRRRSVERDRAERRNRARFEAMVEHGSDLLVVTSASGTASYVSPALEHLLGYPPDSPVAHGVGEILDPSERREVGALLEQVSATGKGGPADLRVRHADGSWRIMEVTLVDMSDVADVAGVLWSSRDVTERRELEQQLERSAFSDPLTGLSNRALFRERLEHAVAREARGGHPVAVLLADLDGFKAVNDSLGHDVGDEVLIEVAARLSGSLRPGDTVARLGGDEFAIILEDVTEPTVAERAAERTLEVMHQPFSVGGTEIRVGMSIGIARADAETGAELLRNADIAMYSAKSNGRGRWAVFEPIMHRRAEDRIRLSNDLDEALARNELEVYYQPSVSITTGEFRGTEALVRWHHPTRGLVMPARFIPVAEETGLIVPIGRWVLRQACRQAHQWHQEFADTATLSISVNLSGRQLADDDLVADVHAVLTETGIDPNTVVLEITESVLMRDVDAVKAKLHQLKALGVRLAIDDFGTGYSSLAYLSQFPVDILKIDRAFVEAAGAGAAGGEALVRAIVELAAGLHLATIAEGIEQQHEADLMLALGCPTGQGFLYARPLPPNELHALLASRILV
jgi:diguanylate cyclase (GGDEF)-like protein/PAS domain S-box-containing protein